MASNEIKSAEDYTKEIAHSPSNGTQDEKHAIRQGSVTVIDLADKLGDNQDGLAPLADLELVQSKVDSLSVEECREHLGELLKDHEWDYNFSEAQRSKIKKLLAGPTDSQTTDEWEALLRAETAINKFFSPYPEVRAITQPNDDVDMPCETIRAHLLGYIWACVAQFINSLFNSRFPQVIIQSSVAQILLYPCGLLLAATLPDVGFTLFGKRHSLNPGPWNYKEQMLATIITNVSVTSAYVFWNIQTETVYYGDTWLTPGYKILLLWSTQLMGVGFAGLMRRFVVYPVQTFWPSILPTLALNRALLLSKNSNRKVHGWSISTYKFFWVAFIGMFCYFWLPDFLFQALSYFSWMTWIAPNNFNLAAVTGSQFGLGFNPISSFDWNVFGTLWYPLAYPFFSYATMYGGMFLGGLIILGMYYTNYKGSGYLPINSSGIFDNTGSRYNQSRVIRHGVLDESLYVGYSPAFYSAGNILLYSAFFAYYPLNMVFTLLDSWRPLSKAYRQFAVATYKQTRQTLSSLKNAVLALARGQIKECGHHIAQMASTTDSVYDGFDDPFCNMMRNYAEVPDWWFFVVFLVAFIFAIAILSTWTELQTPVWTIFFVIGINLIFLIPMTFLWAISGLSQGLNIITELIVGYALPGHPEALMFVKAYGYNINGQADTFITDLKMGHYAKIPPRAMFRGQIISILITSLVAYGVVEFVDGFDGICTPDQVSQFTCAAGSQVYFSASIVWGAIGPKRIFSQIYPEMKYAFLIGFLLALVWYALKREGPRVRSFLQRKLPSSIFKPLNLAVFTPMSWLKNIHPVLILQGMLSWAPTNLAYFTGGLYFSIAFMWYVKRYKTAWFEKYNYVLSAAFSGGVAFSAIIIFFAVQYHPVIVSWWGNEVITKGVDGGADTAQGALLTQLPAKGFFGPDTWY